MIVRANRVERAEDWAWCSAGQQLLPEDLRVALTDGPLPRRGDWLRWVNRPQTQAEEAAIRRCISQSRPYGDERWLKRTMTPLGWTEPGRPGRPRKPRGKSGAVPV